MTWTKLHEACERCSEGKELLPLVSECHEDLLSTDDHGSTALHLLCWTGDNPNFVEDVVDAILRSCPQAASAVDLLGNTPLHVACACPATHKHLVQLLLDAFPDAVSTANREGMMPLHMACRYAPHNESVIGLLLDVYPYAVRSAIKIGSPAPKALEALDRKPTDHPYLDPHGRSGSSPRFMSHRYHTDLSFQARDGSFPLHMAIQSRAPRSVLEMLIKEDPDSHALRNKFGETPLHVALKQQQQQHDADTDISNGVAELLLASLHPDVVRIRDGRGNLPLHVAAMHGCTVHVAKGLLEAWPESIHEASGEPDALEPLELAIRRGKCDEHVLRLLSISSGTAVPVPES